LPLAFTRRSFLSAPAFALQTRFSRDRSRGERRRLSKSRDWRSGRWKGARPDLRKRRRPTALVFIHQLERSLVPLLRVVEQYGVERRDRIKTEIVFLAGDRLAGEERVRAAAGSLKLAARVGLSLDVREGPGNYGLNKDCLMTIITARTTRSSPTSRSCNRESPTAPKVVAALAKTCGDDNPPTAEALAARQPGMARGRGAMPEKPKEDFPGAVPSDAKLVGLLRQFIRPTNDDATVDRVLADVKTHIKDNADLTKQAADGWTRVLHFGDRYGTPYARKVGQEFLDQIKTP
jgi:hypothetical protein